MISNENVLERSFGFFTSKNKTLRYFTVLKIKHVSIKINRKIEKKFKISSKLKMMIQLKPNKP